MEQNFAIQLFEGKKVRFVWDAERDMVDRIGQLAFLHARNDTIS